MKKRNYLIWAGALAGAVALTGCGSETTTSSLNEDATAAKTASVNLSVAFPEGADASKSVIPTYAQGVGFRYCKVPTGSDWCDLDFPDGSAMVTRDNPTASVSLVPGNYLFGAAVSTTADMLNKFDYAQTGGEIIDGSNSIVMSFLQGDWTLNNGTADETLTLGDGTVITGFKLKANPYATTQPAAAAQKSAFDATVPAGGMMEYAVTLKTSAGDIPAGGLLIASQFHSGNSNNATLFGMDQNITQGCSYWDDYHNVCNEQTGDLVLHMLSDPIVDTVYSEDAVFALLPAGTIADGTGAPLDISGVSRPDTGVRIIADLVEVVLGTQTISLVDTAAAAAKAVAADLPRSRSDALKAAFEGASKSVTTTDIGTINSTWYDPVIMASDTGTNRGTWNFDDYVWDETTQTSTQVVDGCLQTDATSGKVYAECGYLNSVWDSVTSTYVADAGEFSWGFAPTDPTNLGEYGNCNPDAVAVGVYEPWCFWDANGDGTTDMGSFQFTHYMRVDETMTNARKHSVALRGVELPIDDVIVLQ